MKKHDSQLSFAENPFGPDLGAFEIFFKFSQKSKNWKVAWAEQLSIKNYNL